MLSCCPVRRTDQPWWGSDAGSVDDFHQQPPGGNEVGPAVARYAGTVAGDFLALPEHAHPRGFLQHGDRFVYVVHNEAQVVPAGVAMPWRGFPPFNTAPLEEFNIEVRRQAQHGEREFRICRDVEVCGHEFFVGPAFGAVQLFSSKDFDEEPDTLLKVWHRQADVVRVLEPRQPLQCFCRGAALLRVHLRGPEVEARTRSSGSRTMWSTEPSMFCFSASSMAM